MIMSNPNFWSNRLAIHSSTGTSTRVVQAFMPPKPWCLGGNMYSGPDTPPNSRKAAASPPRGNRNPRALDAEDLRNPSFSRRSSCFPAFRGLKRLKCGRSPPETEKLRFFPFSCFRSLKRLRCGRSPEPFVFPKIFLFSCFSEPETPKMRKIPA